MHNLILYEKMFCIDFNAEYNILWFHILRYLDGNNVV